MSADIELQDQVDEVQEPFEEDADLYAPYRRISRAAVASLIFAGIGLIGLIVPAMLVFAAAGLLLAVLGRKSVKRYPDELSGGPTAVVGIIACTLLLAGGSAMHAYIYLTEVPDGYQRISFADLQPDKRRVASGKSKLPVELDGHRIFVKGYVHPGVSSVSKIKKFILVPDMGTCCFGGQPSLTDMIEVTIVGAPGIRYSQRKRKLGGTFRVSNMVKSVAGGLQGGYYELRADYVK